MNCAEITEDQGNLRTKFSALNVDFNSASFDPIGSRSPPYEGINFGYPIKTRDFCYCGLYSIAWERLQIEANLLLISTADDLSGVINIDDLKRPWNLKTGFFLFHWSFCDFRLRRTFNEWIFAEITGDRPGQPAYEIKLLLSRFSWALAQIYCI